MPIDYSYVAKLAYWTTPEGIAYLLDVNTHDVGYRHEGNWPLYDKHKELLTLVHRAIEEGQLQGRSGPGIVGYKVRPNEFIRWACKLDLKVPAALRAALDQTQRPQRPRAAEQHSAATATMPPVASEVAAQEPALRKHPRSDLMAPEIDRAIQELGGVTDQARIMGRLQSYAGRSGSCIIEAGPGFVLWRDAKGIPRKLSRDTLRKRLDRRAERARK